VDRRQFETTCKTLAGDVRVWTIDGTLSNALAGKKIQVRIDAEYSGTSFSASVRGSNKIEERTFRFSGTSNTAPRLAICTLVGDKPAAGLLRRDQQLSTG
jgi:hypothetical protein